MSGAAQVQEVYAGELCGYHLWLGPQSSQALNYADAIDWLRLQGKAYADHNFPLVAELQHLRLRLPGRFKQVFCWSCQVRDNGDLDSYALAAVHMGSGLVVHFSPTVRCIVIATRLAPVSVSA